MYETSDLEIYIFEKINRHWTNSFLNWMFPQLTDLHKNKYFIFTLIMSLILFILFKYSKSPARKSFLNKIFIFILGITITGACSDSFSYYGLKKNIERFRPEVEFRTRLLKADDPENLNDRDSTFKFPIVRAPFVGDRSLPSNHASNASAIAMFIFLFLSLVYNKKYYSIFFLPAIIGYSRIYVGVHWPSDVIIGFILGSLIGLIAFKLFNKVLMPFFTRSGL